MSSPEDSLPELSPEACRLLLRPAREAIAYGAVHGRPPEVDLGAFPPALREPRASFVTLRREGALRGCMGSLEAVRPLAEDVVHNAFAAAFEDPRFPPVGAHEVDWLHIHISVLTPPEPIPFTDEADLMAKIRPGIDGLTLYVAGRRATLLPSVWDSVADVGTFLAHLKRKAGVPTDYWSDDLRVERYRTIGVSETEADGQ